MEIIPAIDIMNGKCVRLTRGKAETAKVYAEDPIAKAMEFIEQGIKCIHIVDIDAAMGTKTNSLVIRNMILDLPVKVQVAGGIRTIAKTEAILEMGVSKVIFGTVAVEQPEMVKKAVQRFGKERIVVAVDEVNGKVAIRGWQETRGIDYLQFAQEQEAIGVGAIQFTATARDGTLSGPALEKIQALIEAVNIPVVTAGGVGRIKDIVKLKELGISGAIVGTALYEKKLTIPEMLEVVKNAD